MLRKLLALRLQTRTGPEHGGGLVRALGRALEPRPIPLPACRPLGLGTGKFHLHGADGARDGAVADRSTIKLGRYRRDDRSRSEGNRAAALAIARNCGWLSRIGMDTPIVLAQRRHLALRWRRLMGRSAYERAPHLSVRGLFCNRGG